MCVCVCVCVHGYGEETKMNDFKILWNDLRIFVGFFGILGWDRTGLLGFGWFMDGLWMGFTAAIWIQLERTFDILQRSLLRNSSRLFSGFICNSGRIKSSWWYWRIVWRWWTIFGSVVPSRWTDLACRPPSSGALKCTAHGSRSTIEFSRYQFSEKRTLLKT